MEYRPRRYTGVALTWNALIGLWPATADSVPFGIRESDPGQTPHGKEEYKISNMLCFSGTLGKWRTRLGTSWRKQKIAVTRSFPMTWRFSGKPVCLIHAWAHELVNCLFYLDTKFPSLDPKPLGVSDQFSFYSGNNSRCLIKYAHGFFAKSA